MPTSLLADRIAALHVKGTKRSSADLTVKGTRLSSSSKVSFPGLSSRSATWGSVRESEGNDVLTFLNMLS